MALGIVKPADNPDLISILLSTRQRPEHVKQFLSSVHNTVTRPDLVDVWIYRDLDDESELPTAQDTGQIRVRTIRGPRLNTLGENFNSLRQECSSNPGIYFPANDKLRFETKGWDEEVRAAFASYPDRLALVFLQEQVNQARFASTFFLSAEWANALGRIHTEYFPFWYEDTWLNSVGQMLGRFHPLQGRLTLELGETQRMQNLPFWEHFFNCSLPLRIAEAEHLRRLTESRPGQTTFLSDDFANKARKCWHQAATVTSERFRQLKKLERTFSKRLQSPAPRDVGDSQYRNLERRAANLMRTWANTFTSRDDISRIESALEYTSDAAEEHFRAIQKLLEQGNFSQAHVTSRRLLSQFPNFPESHELLARAEIAAGHFAEAEVTLGKARQVFPAYASILQLHGAVLFHVGHLRQAEATFDLLAERARKGELQDQDLLINLGEMDLARERYHEALTWFEMAAANDNSDLDAWSGIASASTFLNDESRHSEALNKLECLRRNGTKNVTRSPEKVA